MNPRERLEAMKTSAVGCLQANPFQLMEASWTWRVLLMATKAE
jgi:hypothetical protein